ncbi:LPXTG cell wall anchor domain-containing protein [Micromonospora sp. WMMD964]|uniref:DUF7507 domain-containing protein n=1 Tax=Micromonospora sp. WMMD964 TaxID=3016091 RepID=UPI00249AE710|nr:LPXTG cell wall anchor domain-containing protein [Micromonospora sp. WMMD964]WFF02698.1 LPXTG cell wall anchor domain-containing protein [Micromonospora sp. WMMD964]
MTNAGTVTLTGVTVTDALVAPADPAGLEPITCGPDRTPNGAVTLPAAATVTCTTVYTATKADLRNGSVTNTATATGTPPAGPAPIATESRLTIPTRVRLPVTGGSLDIPLLAGAAVAVLLLGVALILVTRRRRARRPA